MMPGILIGGKDASGKKVDIAYLDYGSVISQTGTLADVHLETVTPKAYPDGMFGFDFARVHPEPLGISLDAAGIQQVWNRLEKDGFPLEKVITGLVLWDVIDTLRGIPSKTQGMVHRYYGATPSFARLVELVGHMGEIQKFKPEYREGFENRMGELRRNLNGIFKSKVLGQTPQIEYLHAVQEAGIAIMAKESEFNVLKQLLAMGHKCTLLKSGSDFNVVDCGNLRCEVKSRHENVFQYLISEGRTQGVISPDPLSLLPEGVFALLSWAVFGTVRRALDEQKSNILFCDLSNTFAGVLLPAVEQFWKINLSFTEAVKNALNIASNENQVAIVFISLPGITHHLKATVFNRSDIGPVGKALWDINKQLSLHSPELAKFLGEMFKGK